MKETAKCTSFHVIAEKLGRYEDTGRGLLSDA